MSTQDRINEVLDNYIKTVRNDLQALWKRWPLDLTKKEMHEVIGALLARQVSLSTHLAMSPAAWNGHLGSLILRSMTDAHITLAWILKVDPLDRSIKFIEYGLGQAKLQLEHVKKQIEAEGGVVKDNPTVKAFEGWINEQRLADLTEVDVGAWSGLDTRKMAEEAGCIDLYHYAYAPFSASVHNTWHHIAVYNLQFCPNPLHRYHRIPIDRVISPDLDFVYRAARYVEKSFKLFTEKIGIGLEGKSAYQNFCEAMDALVDAVDTSETGDHNTK
ncbi:MAG: hypothetical protein OJF51_004419 [Nitrospira sp.]|jgi:hypothetical protein|nr:MAG: hypothetical protein OJF51_004419 [Nitrospira sp.]